MTRHTADAVVIDKYLVELLNAACESETWFRSSLMVRNTVTLLLRKRRKKSAEWWRFLRDLLQDSEELRKSVKALLDADKHIKAQLETLLSRGDQITKATRGGVR